MLKQMTSGAQLLTNFVNTVCYVINRSLSSGWQLNGSRRKASNPGSDPIHQRPGCSERCSGPSLSSHPGKQSQLALILPTPS